MKKIILASANQGKVREIQEYWKDRKIIPYTDLMGKFEILENGKSFKENAIIKAKAIFDRLDKKQKKDFIVIADDSGLSVPALGNIPGIYSARFAKEGASDKENIDKLINILKQKNIKITPAYYTACIALANSDGIFTVHGWMYGDIIDEIRGDKGFGYDPMFIPKGFDKTLGELETDIKKTLSHRTKALDLIKKLI